MKKNMVFQTALMGCVILFCCCATGRAQDVRYNYAPGTDFAKYKTYRWVRIPDVRYPDQILDGQIKAAIDSQLSLKGVTQTDSETADLYVTYQLAINQQTQWNAYATGGGMAGGMGYGRWGGMGMGMGTATATSSTINVGTLVLDFYDVAAKQQIWRGDATKTLNPSKDPQKNQKNLQKAMAKLLKNYPPPPPK